MAAANDRNVRLVDFTGEGMSILEWTQHVDLCRTAAAWTDAQTAERAKLHISGKARTWLQNQILAQTPGIAAWFPPIPNDGGRPPNLKTLLIERFLQANTPSEQARLRQSLTQQADEDVACFRDRVVAIQFALDQNLPVAFREGQKVAYDLVHMEQVLTNFIVGLRPDIATHVTTLNVMTMQDAFKAAVSFEQATKAKKGKVNAMSQGKDQGSSAEQPEELANRIAAIVLGQIRGRGRGQGRGRGRGSMNSTPFCPYCGFVNHTIEECNIRKKDIKAGIHLERSPYFAPGRVGRGRGGGRGSPRGRGQQYGQSQPYGQNRLHSLQDNAHGRPFSAPGLSNTDQPQYPFHFPQTGMDDSQFGMQDAQAAGSSSAFRFYQPENQ